MFKVNYGNYRLICEICSKLSIKTPEQRHWSGFRVFIFEQIPHINFGKESAGWSGGFKSTKISLKKKFKKKNWKLRICSNLKEIEVRWKKVEFVKSRNIFIFELIIKSHLLKEISITYRKRRLGCLKLKMLKTLLPVNIGQTNVRKKGKPKLDL